jgi:hypothetical protein
MRPCADSCPRLILAHLEHATNRLDFSHKAPPSDERTRQRGIGEIDRKSIVQHASRPEGVIAHPWTPQFSSSQVVIWV